MTVAIDCMKRTHNAVPVLQCVLMLIELYESRMCIVMLKYIKIYCSPKYLYLLS